MKLHIPNTKPIYNMIEIQYSSKIVDFKVYITGSTKSTNNNPTFEKMINEA